MAASGRSVRDVPSSFVDTLAVEHGWAAADSSAAEAWVDPVLERVRSGERLAPLASDTMRRTGPVGNGLELCIEWAGEPHLNTCVRRVGDAEWTLYSHVTFPPDDDGKHRIEFTPERFNGLTEAWVGHQFDASKARRRLAEASR